MIQIENTDIHGWEHAIKGMRNPKNSWDRIDSTFGVSSCNIGQNDKKLMQTLASGGSVHAKYRRMIVVWVDVTAPLYWWKEFDTYKVGTVANSCSTMHRIHERAFTYDDFSHEHLTKGSISLIEEIMDALNYHRLMYNKTKDKMYWWQMIQLLPSSYNQKRTIKLNYEVLTNIYHSRKYHKLDEWRAFCEWIESLPHSDLITGESNEA